MIHIAEQWRALELRDANSYKSKAAVSGNRLAWLAADGWALSVAGASAERLSVCAEQAKSVDPEGRRRTLEALGMTFGYSTKAVRVEACR